MISTKYLYSASVGDDCKTNDNMVSSVPSGFEKTLNGYGITLLKPDDLGELFLDGLSSEDTVLDIGAGLGVNTLPALAKGAQVVANDLSKDNLAEIKQRCPMQWQKNLTLSEGRFPSQLHFPPKTFDRIICSRVLQFLTGKEIEQGIATTYRWLKPKGKIYVIAPTVYRVLFSKLLPIYHERKKQQIKWYGEVENIHNYTASSYKYKLPKFLHLLDDEVLSESFESVGFQVDKCTLTSVNQLPLKDKDEKPYVILTAQRP